MSDMTVKELIEKLKKVDQDSIVGIFTMDGTILTPYDVKSSSGVVGIWSERDKPIEEIEEKMVKCNKAKGCTIAGDCVHSKAHIAECYSGVFHECTEEIVCASTRLKVKCEEW